MIETAEIVATIDHLNRAFDDLIVRGLRSAGREDLNVLSMLQSEFERIGAHHLASAITSIIQGIESGDPRTASKLFKAQASLRVFERIFTLNFAKTQLEMLHALTCSADEPSGDHWLLADEADFEDDDLYEDDEE